TANKREYPLILKFAFIGVHSRFEIWASYLIDNPEFNVFEKINQKSSLQHWLLSQTARAIEVTSDASECSRLDGALEFDFREASHL
ncbi:hypothetical protein DCC62_24310, partial [candidate division KSB1 bacterium]